MLLNNQENIMATAAPKKPAAKPATPAKTIAKTASVAEAPVRANGDLTIAAKLSSHDKVVSVNYNFGKDLVEMTELFSAFPAVPHARPC